MRIYIMLVIVAFLSISCKKETKNLKIDNNNNIKVVKNKTLVDKKTERNDTFLCKINGKDWSYTKASGLVSRHKKTKKRTAIITFTKQLEKGKETVQLYYDGDTNQLEKVSIHLKQPKKDGGRMTAMYQLQVNGGKRHPESEILGTINLSNPKSASGNAEISKVKIRFEGEQLQDENMTMISLSPLDFSGIGYSDSEKLFGSKND